jgi:ribosomal protein L30E
MTSVAEIRKRLEQGTVAIGTKLTLQNLRKGRLEKVLVTKNCPKAVVSEIKSLAENTEIEQLDILNSELGTSCKKPFSISVIGFLRGANK